MPGRRQPARPTTRRRTTAVPAPTRRRRAISEAEFQQQVTDLADLYAWLWYHNPDSRRSNAGFPDLVLVKAGRVIFAELKSAAGKVRPEQRTWLAALATTKAEVYIWRPDDLDAITTLLRG